ncbi:aldehyde dehydrogenase family protein [Mesorhizobium sp.]|uniref:aldehyde dehydrogenase family protein n=1 Tax=Mesorhizobium sp. TaxID=1871066 RepID=UPI000FE2BF08|nr:aldehyde dehydrogenase family protein [Mesorhizobium sp.]RWN94519.1 MAG: aldehyde dehydrogenase family protein [Mesorhizobium sp.]
MLDDVSQDKDRLAARLSAREPVFWTNAALARSRDPGAYRSDIDDAQGRLRGARYHLQNAFPVTRSRSGVVVSPLVTSQDLVKRWLVNADDSLPGSTKVREEISGPVLSAIEIEEEAIKVVNDTNCGLASQLYTDNLQGTWLLGSGQGPLRRTINCERKPIWARLR